MNPRPRRFLRPAVRIAVAGAAMLLLAATAGAADSGESSAAGAAAPVSYHRQIRPIFQANCQGCHQPAKRGGEYVMTEFDQLLAGGESGAAAIVAGDVDASYLVTQIEPIDGFAEMPQDAAPLDDAEVELIKSWIAQGAKDDTPEGAAARYDADNPPRYALPPVVAALDFSPDGEALAVSGYHEVVLYKADGSERLARLVGMSPRIESLRFSPDGQRLAVAGGTPGQVGEVQVWDVAARSLIHSISTTFDSVHGVSWSPNGKRIAYGCGDETVRAVDAETGEEVFLSDSPGDWALGTAFSADGKHLAVVSRDRTAKLIELETQRLVDNITSIDAGQREGGLMSIARHPTKDELIIGGADGRPRAFRMHPGDGERKIRDFPALPGRVTAVDYRPDGSQIVAASSSGGRGEVRLYDAENGEQAWKFAGPSVYAVAFAPDGQTIAAAGFDGRVRLIDAEDGKVREEFVPVPLE